MSYSSSENNMVMQASTFISDSIKFIRDDLSANLIDPISGTRGVTDRFVMTAYPKRAVKYPVITVRSLGANPDHKLGMRSQGIWMNIHVEVRAWCRNEKEKDSLTEQICTRLRTNQYGTTGSTFSDDFGLHDHRLLSIVSVEEDGEAGTKSSVMDFEWKAVVDS